MTAVEYVVCVALFVAWAAMSVSLVVSEVKAHKHRRYGWTDDGYVAHLDAPRPPAGAPQPVGPNPSQPTEKGWWS